MLVAAAASTAVAMAACKHHATSVDPRHCQPTPSRFPSRGALEGCFPHDVGAVHRLRIVAANLCALERGAVVILYCSATQSEATSGGPVQLGSSLADRRTAGPLAFRELASTAYMSRTLSPLGCKAPVWRLSEQKPTPNLTNYYVSTPLSLSACSHLCIRYAPSSPHAPHPSSGQAIRECRQAFTQLTNQPRQCAVAQ